MVNVDSKDYYQGTETDLFLEYHLFTMEFNLKLIVDDNILILLDMANKEFIDKCFNS